MVMRMVRSLVSVNSPFLLPSLHRALMQYQKTWGFLQTPLCSRLMVSSYSGHLSADNRQRRAQSEFRVSGVVQPSSLSQNGDRVLMAGSQWLWEGHVSLLCDPQG